MYRETSVAECSSCGGQFPREQLDISGEGQVCQRCREKPFIDAARDALVPRCGLCSRTIDASACLEKKVARLCDDCRASLVSKSPTHPSAGFLIRPFDSFSSVWFIGGYLAAVPLLGLVIASVVQGRLLERLWAIVLLTGLAAVFIWPAEARRRSRPDRLVVHERGLLVEQRGRERFFAWDDVEAVDIVEDTSRRMMKYELQIRLRGWRTLRITALGVDEMAATLRGLHPLLERPVVLPTPV